MYLESDLNVAGFLVAKGHRLMGLELLGTRYSFQFESGTAPLDAASTAQSYHKGAVIPAREFAAALQQLKNELYAAKYRNGNARTNSYDYRR